MAQGDRHCVFKDIVYGLAAGTAATYVMGKVGTFAYQLEDESTQQYEENLRHHEYPPEVLAAKLAKCLEGRELDKETRQRRGQAIHWGYGAFWGGLFGALRDRVPLFGLGCGLAFGLGLWMIGDEVMMPVLGLTPPSTEFPWQNHARAAANHLVYGGTLGITHSVLRKIAG